MKTKALVLFLLIVKISFSQYYTDESLLYSRTGITGTARSAGAGGAFGSIGADLGSLDINPAGLGLYRSTEFLITPGLKVSNNQTNYDGTNANTSLPRLFLGQAGIEWTKILKEPSRRNEISFNPNRLRSITFAINYQAENFYARSQNFNALNTTSSMIDNYTAYLNYYNVSALSIAETAVANAVNLIGQDQATGKYFSNVPAPVYQAGNIETRGSNDKLTFGFGGNFNDKLYFGLSLSIPFINYSYTTNFSETNAGDSVPSFQSYSLSSWLDVSGVGITGSLGLIYRPVTWLRLGAAYHLPSWYSMNETYNSTINYANFDTAGIQSSFYTSPPYSYPPLKYNFRTPMKGVFSASFFFKQYGFLSVDYELQDLASSHFNFGSGNEAMTQSVNDSIKKWYALEHTIRIGLEGAYKKLRVRAGYAYSSSPYKSSAINNLGLAGYAEARQNITAGLGLRFDRFYIDFAYVYTFTKDISYPLAADNAYNNYNSSTMLLTFGWKMNRSTTHSRRSNNNNSLPPADDQKF